MAKRYPLCRCGHRYYKHKRDGYPIDDPECMGIDVPKYSPFACRCGEYEAISNLEYLERKYIESVDKNV